MLLNVLSNAVKFTEKGGVEIHVTCLEKNDQQALLKISVTDTGIGIAGNQYAEDHSGTRRQNQAPGQREPAGGFDPAMHAPFHGDPEISQRDHHEPGVKDDVPGEDRFEIVVGDGDDQAVGSTEIEQ